MLALVIVTLVVTCVAAVFSMIYLVVESEGDERIVVAIITTSLVLVIVTLSLVLAYKF